MNFTRNVLKVVLWSMIVCSFSSCLEQEVDSVALQEAEDATRMEKLNAAKCWYNNHKSVNKTRGVNGQQDLYEGDPSWKYFAVNAKNNLTAVDIDLTDCATMDLVPKENNEAFQRTGNWDFRRSYTRLVYTMDKNTHKERGFLMTIIPSKYYAKTYSKRMRINTYLHRDKYLSGYVLFFQLNGKFVNGWEYKKGKVIGKIRHKLPNEVPDGNHLSVRMTPVRYKVLPKVYHAAQTRSDSEDGGWDIDWGELPEVVATADAPNPEPPDDSWMDWPIDSQTEPDPNPDDNSGYIDDTQDEEGYTPSGNQDANSDFTETVNRIKTELGKMGVDVSKLTFQKTTRCSGYARIGETGEIEICNLFFQLNSKTQVAVVWHEVFHLNNDKPCLMTMQDLPNSIVVNPPSDIKEIILRGIDANKDAVYAATVLYQSTLFTKVHDPVYIQNEINAYASEISKFPSKDLDPDYAEQRALSEWKFQEEIKLANKYFKK